MRGIAVADVPHVWQRVRPMIEKAVAYSAGKYLADDFYDPLLRGDMQLWVNEHSAAMTEILNYPHRRICNIVACGGGDLGSLARDLEIIEAWARHRGCQGMRIEGRPGWQRILRNYNSSNIILERTFE